MSKLTTSKRVQGAASGRVCRDFAQAAAAGFADGFDGGSGANGARLAEVGAYSPKYRRGQRAPQARSERASGDERGCEPASGGRGE